MAKRKCTKRTEVIPNSRANWGAHETPRHCRKCPSINSTIDKTMQFKNPARTIRHRICKDCGQRYSTIDLLK